MTTLNVNEKHFDLKKFLITAAAGSTAMWILAGVWHELVMSRFYAEAAHAEHEGLGIILLAYLVLGAFMGGIFPLLNIKKESIVSGIIFGALIGLLWVFPHELAMAGAHGKSVLYVSQNGAWHMVEQGFGGAVIALVYRR